MATQIKRRYVLTRVSKGDYLLPSNDGLTIWRIHTYEDGPSHGLEDWPRDRTLWALRRWSGRVAPSVVADIEDWDRWEYYDDGFERRSDAVDTALRAGGS